MRRPPIILAPAWGARPPRGTIVHTGKPRRVIFHHTAGHHPELDQHKTESSAEAAAYARAIQAYHMGQGWLDSGHNFLVCRNGLILEGRHGSVDAIARGRMIVSAHCPGQNDQPGIEHEHTGGETLTPAQFRATVRLHAWILHRCAISPSQIRPHRAYYATSCPGTLEHEIPRVRDEVRQLLEGNGREMWGSRKPSKPGEKR